LCTPTSAHYLQCTLIPFPNQETRAVAPLSWLLTSPFECSGAAPYIYSWARLPPLLRVKYGLPSASPGQSRLRDGRRPSGGWICAPSPRFYDQVLPRSQQTPQRSLIRGFIGMNAAIRGTSHYSGETGRNCLLGTLIRARLSPRMRSNFLTDSDRPLLTALPQTTRAGLRGCTLGST